VALAWCFPDDAGEYADGVLVALEGRAILVPALWSVEITNAVFNKRRISGCLTRLRRSAIRAAGRTDGYHGFAIRHRKCEQYSSAREYGLSAYDAAYLDVAVRHAVPLATLDSTLQEAGRKAGIEIFKGNVDRE
jgi:predicted nucleic acid-binding protein